MKEVEPKPVDCRYCGCTWTPGSNRWNNFARHPCGSRVHDIQREASRIARDAVKKGLLPNVKTLSCVDCGAQATEWEHRDYSKPLEVEPTCRRCNRLRGPGLIPGMALPPKPQKRSDTRLLIHLAKSHIPSAVRLSAIGGKKAEQVNASKGLEVTKHAPPPL